MSQHSSSPGKILIFSGVRGDTRRYRTLHLYEQLRLAGADCILSHLTDPRLPEYTRQASAAVLHRVPYDRHVETLFRSLRERNALVVLDADDFLYDPAVMRWIDSPDFQDPIRAALYRRELLRHRATLDHCDAVTVSTQFLGSLIEPFDRPVRIHRNAYSLEMLSRSELAFQNRRSPDGRVVIGYASGTRTHDRDFSLVQPVLRGLLESYPQVELWLMGAVDTMLDWGACAARVRTFPLVPWRSLPERLALLDINLAPLVLESPFNQAKSEIKYMEAALVRVPTVASPTDAFRFAIRHGKNGFLASNEEEWRESLRYLIENPNARESIGAAAYEEVLEAYAPWKRGQDFLADLAALAAAHNRQSIPQPAGTIVPVVQTAQSFFTAADEARPTHVDLARYSIRNRGLSTLLGQIWVFFRRKLAPIFPFRKTGAA